MRILNLVYITIILLSITGCSLKTTEDLVYEAKSCRALTYEKQKIDIELEKLSKKLEKSTDYFGYTVAGTGASLSVIPIASLSSYFYVLPGFTILYYNTQVEHNNEAEHKDKLLDKLERIEYSMKEKSCNKI